LPDAHFAEPRLAALYDLLEDGRPDLEVYAAIADELGAESVLDIGCGTGSLACLLARRGKRVTGLDPAGASLQIARAKPGAGAVEWLEGDATTLPLPAVDLVTMTGNVAQVFLTDAAWSSATLAVRRSLAEGGHFVFETRDPAREAWRGWNRRDTYRTANLPGVGGLETWVELTAVELPLVSFRTTFVFAADGAVLTSGSTLRFRSRQEVADSLEASGFTVDQVRDAPDRPGLELVFVASRD
jgi:SAM-dependent methyltransferase